MALRDLTDVCVRACVCVQYDTCSLRIQLLSSNTIASRVSAQSPLDPFYALTRSDQRSRTGVTEADVSGLFTSAGCRIASVRVTVPRGDKTAATAMVTFASAADASCAVSLGGTRWMAGHGVVGVRGAWHTTARVHGLKGASAAAVSFKLLRSQCIAPAAAE